MPTPATDPAEAVTVPWDAIRRLLRAVAPVDADPRDPVHAPLPAHEASAVAVDPPAHDCAECRAGLYVPADRASQALLARAYYGRTSDNTHGIRRTADPSGAATYAATRRQPAQRHDRTREPA